MVIGDGVLTRAVRVGMNAEKSGDVGRIMIVAITDERANISLKRSTDLETVVDLPKPTAQELKDEILEVAGKIFKARMFLQETFKMQRKKSEELPPLPLPPPPPVWSIETYGSVSHRFQFEPDGQFYVSPHSFS